MDPHEEQPAAPAVAAPPAPADPVSAVPVEDDVVTAPAAAESAAPPAPKNEGNNQKEEGREDTRGKPLQRNRHGRKE